MIKYFHLVSSIQSTQRSYTLCCRCSVDEFKKLSVIVCEGTESIECQITHVNQNDEVVEYQVVLPELPGERYLFFAVSKDGDKKGVWKPDDGFDPASLPAGFFFQGIYLNLIYEKKRSRGISFNEPSIINAGFTGIRRNKSTLNFSGYVLLSAGQFDVNKVSLKIIKFREEGVRSSHHVDVSPADEKVFGVYHPELYPRYVGGVVFKIECKVDMDTVKSNYGVFNLYIEHNDVLVTPSNYNRSLAENDRWFPVRISLLKWALFVPFHNEFFNKWRIDIYHLSLFECIKLKLLKKRCSKKPVEKDRKTWLIGEYNSTARDNGMHFYNYLCREKTGVKAYYVIYRNSKQRSNLLGKNVIFYGSYKHFKVAAKAGVLVFSHMPEFLLPKCDLIVRYRGKLSNFKTIFIQHGIIATTASVVMYQKKQRAFDRFVVSSSFEKKIICNYLGYDEKEVINTGLARWDNLMAISKKSSEILIMPTWRNDLENVSRAVFKHSNYYSFWNSLLLNEDFLSLIRKNNIKVNFFLHIGLERFADCFELSPEIRQVNGEDIQKLLSTCGLMVTDYSSAAFDVLLQDKPIIFCPFDYDEMMKLRKGPEFISYEKDLPGPVCYDLDMTVREIIKHVVNGYQIGTRYRDRRKKFFDHIDNHNCDRLYEEIKKVVGL